MKNFFTVKRMCRAGIIAALYVALCYAFMPVAYQGIFQIRPAEALCILPLFFPEAVPALYVGCMLSNLASPFLVYDVFVGSLATLVAALGTYMVGRFIRESRKSPFAHVSRVALGGLFPVLANTFVIPLIIVFLCKDTAGTDDANAAYWIYCLSMFVTELTWVFGLGAPLYAFMFRMRKKGVSVFLDGKKAAPVTDTPPEEQTAPPPAA